MSGLCEFAKVLFDLTMWLIFRLKTGQKKELLALCLFESINTSELSILMHNFAKIFQLSSNLAEL